MGSALLDDAVTAARDAAHPAGQRAEANAAPASVPASALRLQAAERVAAHRSRRGHPGAGADAGPSAAPRNARSAKIAAAVAGRYAQSQSYRDFLAAEAECAVQQARAAAEIAALNAAALAAAKQNLLDRMRREDDGSEELRLGQEALASASPASRMLHESPCAPLLWRELESEAYSDAAAPAGERRGFQPPQSHKPQPRKSHARPRHPAATPSPIPPESTQMPGITVRLYWDEAGAMRIGPAPSAPAPISLPAAARPAGGMQSSEEALLLDEEIAFRHGPVFEGPAGPPEPLPANLIEFPRRLVAARKARPRLAEGPLREETPEMPGAGQLRIFEVDPAQIAVTAGNGDGTEDAHAAQWSSILLDSRPRPDAASPSAAASEGQAPGPAVPQAAPHSLPGVASLRRRMFAAAVNAAILASASAALAMVSFWLAAHIASRGVVVSSAFAGMARAFPGRNAILSALPFAACAFALLAAVYQALFFAFSTATPGMRVARIALCTFSDENPTRRAVRRRLPALLLSALPLGLGYLWAALDEERLAWHDRICGIYQRSY